MRMDWMDWMWWTAVAIAGAVLLVVLFLALCKAQEPTSPEEELRLIREQMEERRRKQAERRRKG